MDIYTNETIMVEAPLGAVRAMLEARDRWLRGEVVVDEDSQPERGATVKGEWWPESHIHRLRDQLPYDGVRTLLSLCSERSGEWIEKSEADAAAGVTPKQLASELGALSKFTLREFGAAKDGKAKWPMEWRKVADKFSYRMSADFAELWKS